MTSGIFQEYESRFPLLKDVAGRLEKHISNLLGSLNRIDRVAARAKSPDRYLAKATKSDENGNPKYKNPILEIQDQIGARITVFYIPDIEIVRNHIQKYFKFIEVTSKEPESLSEFGYFGLHFILEIPSDVLPDEYLDDLPEFFELQIKTLFQHAWSEAHHDLGYKSYRELTPDERRKVAFTAAQAWGADTVFDELAKGLVFNDNIPE